MKIKHSGAAAAVSGLCISLLLVACTGGGTDAMLASAKDYLAKHDNKAAVIQIKNALQKNPDLAEARLLLGTALLDMGDPRAAEVELRKALALKQPADQVVPVLAKAMLLLGENKKLVEEFSKTQLSAPLATAELQTALASAYAAQGKPDLFKAAIEAALVAQPGFSPAVIAQARQKAAARDFDGAMAAAEGLTTKAPTDFEAWRLKGDLLYYVKNQPDEALAAYRKAVEIKADFLPAYTGIMTILLAQNNLDEATKAVDALKKVAPGHPQTRYFLAQLYYQKRDFKTAREQAQQLLKLAPNHAKSLQLAGAVEFQLNSLVQAEALLSKAVQASPELVLARRLLVLTYLRTGQPSKAMATLTPGLSRENVDPELYSVAGEVYLQNGDVKKAEEFFKKATELDPKNSRKRTSLALAHLMEGNSEAAFGELQDIASSDKGTTADLALISAHLRRKDFDKALKAIDGLEKKQPDRPLAANLRGKTLLAKGDVSGARKSFERALTLDPSFFPAVASLASLDMADKKPAEAKKRFEAMLAKDPKNGQALLALAELAVRTGAPKEEIVGLINNAVNANPTEIGPRQLLIDFYMGNKDVRQALSTAQNAVAAMPDNADLLDALGRVQQASGDFNQAIATFNKFSALQPLSPLPYMRLAEAQMAAKNPDGAAQALRKGLEVKPDLLDAQRGLIMLHIQAKKFADATAIARTIQKQRSKEPVGYVLEGDIAAAQKSWDPAIAAYRAGLKEVEVADLAIKLHGALLASNKAVDADKFAATWLKDHPNDPAFRFYMGDLAITRKDYAAAEKNYLAVTKLQPGNATAFNNLAWVTGKLNKEGAVGYAETAIKLSPQQAAYMDTLAMLLADKNDYAKALEWQAKALAAQPQNTLFKLNMAKIYIKAGKKDQAKPLLDELAKLGDKFPAQAEVANLVKSL
jgi:putative PEP-CTERM system TPR-repeat lipoprotein